MLTLPFKPPPPCPDSRHPKTRMFFCERSFGVFFLLWGLVLVLSPSAPLMRQGIFLSHLEQYMSSRYWGLLLIIIGVLRFVAFRLDSLRWRLNFSFVSFVLLSIIATIATYTRLWAATAPISWFVVYVSFWCHRSLLRDLRPLK